MNEFQSQRGGCRPASEVGGKSRHVFSIENIKERRISYATVHINMKIDGCPFLQKRLGALGTLKGGGGERLWRIHRDCFLNFLHLCSPRFIKNEFEMGFL